MRKGIAFLVMSCVLVLPNISCTSAEPERPDLQAEADAIREANQAWFAAERDGDVDAIMIHVAEGAVLLPQEAPPISGLEAIRAMYEEFVSMGLADIGGGPEQIVVSSSGDLAYDIGTNYTVVDGPDGQIRTEGKYLGIWKKVEGQWKAVSVSWSTNTPTGG